MPGWHDDRFTGLFTTDVFVMRADGSHLRRLTHTRSGLSPVFSPNGKRIAFESDDARASQIYLMNPDGSHVRQLTHTADDNMLESWQNYQTFLPTTARWPELE